MRMIWRKGREGVLPIPKSRNGKIRYNRLKYPMEYTK